MTSSWMFVVLVIECASLMPYGFLWASFEWIYGSLGINLYIIDLTIRNIDWWRSQKWYRHERQDIRWSHSNCLD